MLIVYDNDIWYMKYNTRKAICPNNYLIVWKVVNKSYNNRMFW